MWGLDVCQNLCGMCELHGGSVVEPGICSYERLREQVMRNTYDWNAGDLLPVLIGSTGQIKQLLCSDGVWGMKEPHLDPTAMNCPSVIYTTAEL